MTNHKDTDLREALHRKYADKPQLPAGFSERMMKRMEESQPRMEKAEATSNHRKWLYTVIGAVAACGLLLLALNYGGNDKETGNMEQVARNMQKITAPDTVEKQPRSDNNIAQNLPVHKDEVKRAEAGTVTASTTNRDKSLPSLENTDTHVTGDATPSNNHQPSTVNRQPSTITYHPADYGLHYATNEINDSIYQAPSRMDEFSTAPPQRTTPRCQARHTSLRTRKTSTSSDDCCKWHAGTTANHLDICSTSHTSSLSSL